MYHVIRIDDTIHLFDNGVKLDSYSGLSGLIPGTVYLATPRDPTRRLGVHERWTTVFTDTVGELDLRPRKHPPADLCDAAGIGVPDDYIMLDAGDLRQPGDLCVRRGGENHAVVKAGDFDDHNLHHSYDQTAALIDGSVFLRRVATDTVPELKTATTEPLNIWCAMCDTRLTTPLPDHGCCPDHTRIERVLAGHEPDPYAGRARDRRWTKQDCLDMTYGRTTLVEKRAQQWATDQVDRNAAFNRAIDRPTPHYDSDDLL